MGTGSMDEATIRWLRDGPSWIRYAVDTQLLGMERGPGEALDDRNIKAVVRRLKDGRVGLPALRTGKVAYTSSGNAFWDLFFLSDIGLSISDIGMEKEVEAFFDLQREDGTFVLHEATKPRYYCVSAIVLSSLANMGYRDDVRILRFIDTVRNDRRLDGGWHCALNRARGKKLQDTESCPMDNLNVLMFFGRYERFRTDASMNGAIDLLLSHWSRRKEPWRPYGFGIGDQFLQLRYPAVKYGILRVLDVLSLYPYAARRDEFKEMLVQAESGSVDDRYWSSSIYRAYSEFDFGQKKEPSRWITFLINRVRNRADLVRS